MTDVPSAAVAFLRPSPLRPDVRGRRIALGLSLTFLLVLSWATPAAADACNCHIVTAWSSATGLPAHNILAITQDQDGYLWLGTDGGLIRFDGLTFDVWDAPEAPLAGRSIATVVNGRDGSLWVGFDDSTAISRIKDGRVVNYRQRDGPGESKVLTLLEDRAGTIWAGRRNGLSFFRDGAWHTVGDTQGLASTIEVTSLYEDRRGGLWVGTSAGVFRRPADDTRFTLHDAALRNLQAFAEDRTGTIWVADTQRIVKPLAPGQHVALMPGIQLPAGGWRILADGNGTLWVAALGEGLLQIRPAGKDRHVLERVRYEHKIAGGARSLFVDREQHIWVGLRGGGLVRLSESPVTTDIPLEGLTNDGVRALATAGDGSVWIATGRNLNQFHQGSRRTTLELNRAMALHTDRTGRVWAVTGQAVGLIEHGRFTPLPTPAGIRFGWIASFTTGDHDAIWFCSNNQGLLRVQAGVLSRFEDVPAIGDRRCTYVYTDGRGRIWAGFAGGSVAVFEHGRFTVYTVADGVPPGDVAAISEDHAGSVWMASTGGIGRFRDGVFTTATSDNGVPPGIVPSIVVDTEGYVWVGVRDGGGIIRVSPGEIDKADADKTHHIDYLQYTETDGLEALLWASLARPAAVRGGDGRLWFASGRGLAVIDPRHLPARHRVMPPRIERVVSNGRDVPPRADLALPSGTDTIQVHYTAPGLASASKVRFRYMLEGVDSGWVYTAHERQASYFNLQPGRYRFRVAATTGGSWSEAATPLRFTVPVPFYRTGWFYALCALAGISALCGVWWLRLRAVTSTYAGALAERARLSREIHDTLLQSLSGVALELEAVANELDSRSHAAWGGDVRRVRRHVSRCLLEARRSVSELRSPALETRDLVGALQAVARTATDGKAMNIDVVASGRRRRPPPHIEQHLLRIGQEAITNVVRHASARNVRVDVVYHPQQVTLRVSDDGCGFEPGDHSPLSGEHWGLTSMKERADKLSGQFRISSQPAQGTVIEVIAPLRPPDTGMASA